MKKLPKVFKKKWLEALRSGDYKQGDGMLFCDGKYCCLGVADKVCGYSPGKEAGILSEHIGTPEMLRMDGDVKGWLMSMNDGVRIGSCNQPHDDIDYGRKYSFKQIANWIEKNL